MHPIHAVRISTTSQPSPDLVAELAFAGTQLQLSLSASRTLRVLEIQGSRSVLDAFGAKKPASLPVRKAGDRVKAHLEMPASSSIHRADFRWTCDLSVARGGEMVLCIPTTKIPTVVPQPGMFAVVYEHRKPSGLGRQQLAAVYLDVDVERVVRPAPLFR